MDNGAGMDLFGVCKQASTLCLVGEDHLPFCLILLRLRLLGIGALDLLCSFFSHNMT